MLLMIGVASLLNERFIVVYYVPVRPSQQLKLSVHATLDRFFSQ